MLEVAAPVAVRNRICHSEKGSDNHGKEKSSQKKVTVRNRKWLSTCQQQEVTVRLSGTGSDRLE